MSIWHFLLVVVISALLSAFLLREGTYYARRNFCWVCMDQARRVIIWVGGSDRAEPIGICRICLKEIRQTCTKEQPWT